MKLSPVFSQRLLAIEMELDELITGAGGIEGLKFLDRLSTLSKDDQEKALQVCSMILDEFLGSNPAVSENLTKPTLQVVIGGKN